MSVLERLRRLLLRDDKEDGEVDVDEDEDEDGIKDSIRDGIGDVVTIVDEDGIEAKRKANPFESGELHPKGIPIKPSFVDKEKIERIASLTQREKDVYRILLEGYTLKEAAKQVGIKYSTANTYMTGLYKKLGVNSRAELIINYKDTKG